MAETQKPTDTIFTRLGKAASKLIFSYEEVPEGGGAAVATAEILPPVQTAVVVPPTLSSGIADKELVTRLIASAEELGQSIKSFEGFLKSLSAVIPDETQLYRAAYVAAQAANPSLSVKALCAAVDEQIKSLEAENKDFELTVADKVREIVSDKERISSVDLRIQEMLAEVEKLKTQMSQLQITVAQKGQSLENGRKKFTASLEEVKKILQDKKSKIERSLVS